MPFIAICHDQPGDAPTALRKKHLKAHFDYIESILDRILVAGPFGSDAPGNCNASVLVYAVATHAEAEGLLHNDPYFKAGIYGEVRIKPFHPAAGNWIGGTVWS
jgi:uncharacterized protein YciI